MNAAVTTVFILDTSWPLRPMMMKCDITETDTFIMMEIPEWSTLVNHLIILYFRISICKKDEKNLSFISFS